MSTTATIQLSVLLGIALVAKAFGYWLDRYDLVTSSGKLVTGMGYTDQHAVLPGPQHPGRGRADLCRPLLPHRLAPHLAAARGRDLAAAGHLDPARPDLARRSSSTSRSTRPSWTRRRRTSTKNIDATREAYDLNDDQGGQGSAQGHGGDSVQDLIDQTESVPVLDPSRISQAFEQIQQVASYYSVNDVLDVDHYPIEGVDRSLVLGVRELRPDRHHAQPAELDQPPHRLHPRQRRDRGVRQPAAAPTTSSQSQQIQWAEGQGPGQDSLQTATGAFQNQIYFGEGNSPPTPSSGKAPGRHRRRARPDRERHAAPPRRTPAAAASRSAASSAS